MAFLKLGNKVTTAIIVIIAILLLFLQISNNIQKHKLVNSEKRSDVSIIVNKDNLFKKYNLVHNDLISSDSNYIKSKQIIEYAKEYKIKKETERLIEEIKNYQPPQQPLTYEVKKGDCLWTIGITYNLTVKDLKTVNNLTSDIIYEGQILKLEKAVVTIPTTPITPNSSPTPSPQPAPSPQPTPEPVPQPSPKIYNFQATAYTANCGGCTGTTSTGYNVKNTIYYDGMRIVAIDTSIIPHFSIIKISYNNVAFTAINLDSGGAIHGNILDLLVGSYNDAIQFGRRNVTVEVIRWGKG